MRRRKPNRADATIARIQRLIDRGLLETRRSPTLRLAAWLVAVGTCTPPRQRYKRARQQAGMEVNN